MKRCTYKMLNFAIGSDMLIFASHIGTYEKLCVIFLKPYIEHTYTNYREALSIHKAVTLVLQKLALSQSDCNVANVFGVGRTIIFKYTKLVFKALADKNKLLYKYVTIPSSARLQQIKEGFLKSPKSLKCVVLRIILISS